MIIGSSTNLHPQAGQGTIDLTTREGTANRRWGTKLARKKLLRSVTELREGNDKHNNNGLWGNNDGDNASMPPPLFRRIRGAWEGGRNNGFVGGMVPMYRNVEFLNTEVVVASMNDLRFDVVRLPNDVGVVAMEGGGNGGDASRRARKGRRRGELVVDGLGSPCQNGDGSGVKMRGLSDAQAFVVGLPSGEFRIFSTEYGSMEWRVDQICRENLKGPFFTNAFKFGPLLRRYWREWNRPDMTLAAMLRSRRPFTNPSDLLPIPNWDINPPTPHLCNRHKVSKDGRFGESLWDFRETGSTLLAAHVHPQMDCFSIRTIDKHVRYTDGLNESVNKSSCGDGTQPLIYVDASSVSSKGGQKREDITGICFMGDWGIATAHVQQTIPCGSGNGEGVEEVVNILKLWDRRFVAGDNYYHGVRSKRDGSVKLVSFPRNEAVLASAEVERCVARPRFFAGEGVSELVDPIVGGRVKYTHSLPIVGLSAPFGEYSNSVCVSLHGSEPTTSDATDPCCTTEDLLIDTVNPMITRRIELTSNVCDTLCHLPTFSTDLGFMARYYCRSSMEHGVEITEEKVLLYDLSNPSPIESMCLNYFGEEGRRRVGKRQREENGTQGWRRSDSTSDQQARTGMKARGFTNGCPPPQCAVDKGSYGTLPLTLLDEDGLPSRTTCLSLNHDGTSVVFGSSDGDLFLY